MPRHFMPALEIASLAYKAGFRHAALVMAVAVALAESLGEWTVRSRVDKADATWDVSLGLWQIRPLKADYGKGTFRDAKKLADPWWNAQAAYDIYDKAGKSFKPWGAYTSGRFNEFYAKAQDAVKRLGV